MKEFVKTVKQCFRASRDELSVFGVITLFAGIAGIVVGFLLMNTEAMEGEYGTMGAVIGVAFETILFFCLATMSLQQDFNLAISMGKTRKHYIPARFLFLVVTNGICLAVAGVITLVEHFLYSLFFPERGCAFDLFVLLLHPAALIGFLFLIPAMVLVAGACFLRFGPKCGWVFWALWMIFCIGFPKLMHAIEEEKDSTVKRMMAALVDFVKQLTPSMVAVGMLVLGLAALAVAFGILRKQRVTA